MKEQSPSTSSGQALSLKEKAARAVSVGLIAGVGTLPDPREIHAADIQKHLETPNKHELNLEQGMPSANALMEAGFQIGGNQQETKLASKGDAFRGYEVGNSVEASQTITETLQNLIVTREWLEQNPQSVKGSTKTTVDADGNVTAFFTLNGNKHIYKSERNANNKFEKYQAVSGDEIPMENPRDIAVSPDGRVRLAVGEDPIRTGVGKAFVSYDNKPWKVIAGSLPGVGHYAEFITTTVDNKLVFVFSTLAPEDQPGKYLPTIDPQTQTEQVQATNSTGSTFGVMSKEVNQATKEIELITLRFGTSGFWIEKINWETGAATIEHIDTVSVNGTSINLGTCFGAGRYIDPANGHRHIVTSNPDRDIHYDIDVDSPEKTATAQYHANWFDGKGIPNYIPGSLAFSGFQIIADSQGNLREFFFGSYGSSTDHDQRAVAGKYPLGTDPSSNPDIISLYDLFPNKASAVGQGKVIKINNQAVFENSIAFAGSKVLLTEDGSIFYPVSGFGESPSVPTPTPTPERPFRVYLPVSWKALVTSSWRKVKRLFTG